MLSDAESFTPPGTKVHSYTRRSPSATGKGKGIAPPQPDDEDAVEYEVYHVRIHSALLFWAMSD